MNLLSVLAATGLSAIGALPARWLGLRYRLLTRDHRRLPATGGVSLLGAWWLAALLAGGLERRILLGLLLATIVILLIGVWDLRRPLGWLPQLGAQLLAAVSAVVVGQVTALYVTNPSGGLLRLDSWSFGGIAFPAVLLSAAWIVFLMNAVNFLDGLDGLATTVSAIGFLAIGAVSLLPQVSEPTVALPAFLASGAAVGFLFWSFPPARLTLGTPGSWFLGFLLAVLSLQGSSKIATLAVVGAVPLLDAVAVVAGRLRRGQSPFRGDYTHLHHRLARRGLPPRAILSFYSLVSVLLAAAAVVLPTPFKILLVSVSGSAVIFFALTQRADHH